MTDPVLSKLSDLLSQERAALLAGDFDRVTELATQKLALLTHIEASSLQAETLVAAKADIKRNQTLYQSAISGVSSARSRLEALANVRGGLSIYDQQGKISKVATGAPGIERKA